ncbi:hypothetical protein RB195_007465 [Necator americanus]|uniref:Uncharacterized protein n=1 Tax=Necator americanus TaxID=51031 RepID=A0ABR1BXF3_NECAM
MPGDPRKYLDEVALKSFLEIQKTPSDVLLAMKTLSSSYKEICKEEWCEFPILPYKLKNNVVRIQHLCYEEIKQNSSKLSR